MDAAGKIEREIRSAGNDDGSREGFYNKNRDAPPVGILRLDIGKPRRHSVEFRHLAQGEPSSPQPSVDRLSVTFAEGSVRSDSLTNNSNDNNACLPTTSVQKMDKVHFPQQQDEDDSLDEEYSASVTAIMQRRASTKKMRRRNSRRASSPFSPDILPGSENGRRRSSVFTTSSGDTAITVDDNLAAEATKDEIFENIRLHKEVLSNVKMQPWNMRKKLRLVVQAKAYIKKHEGVLQEKLAQSRSTKDMLARWNIYLIKKWQGYRREIANLSNWLIPWERKIKEIESHFGSVVASYFIFLRWLFWVNLVVGIVLLAFVAIPEMLIANRREAGERKLILAEDKYNATNFLTLWDFEGFFKYSPLFYGWYTNSKAENGYRMPFAYFLTGLFVYGYSFFATLRKMAANSRMSKLSEKDDDYTFSWKLFTGWDYMIGNPETAQNRIASIIMGFKEALLEEAEKKREPRNWRIIVMRIFVNIGVLALLSLSAFAVVMVVKRTTEPEANSTVWRRNEVTVVMSLISLFFPMIFEALGYFEQYHPRKQLRLQLARIMLLNLLTLYSLIFALFDKITDMTDELKMYEKLNLSITTQSLDITSTMTTTIATNSSLIHLTAPTTVDYPLQTNNINAIDFARPDLINFFNESDLGEHFSFQNTVVDPLYYLLYQLLGFSNNASNITGNSNATAIYYDFENLTTGPDNNFTTDLFYDERFDRELSTSASYDETVYENGSLGFALPLNAGADCSEQTCATQSDELFTGIRSDRLNYTFRSKLRSLCWETMFGQELVKLTVMDLIFAVLQTMTVDFFRGIFVRFMNRCWCWDLEKKFPQYGDFKVAENILHLINNQGLVWMGMFFSPGLVLINTVKLYIMMYLRSWAVLTCNVPHEVIFRASRSNNFYYALLLMMLFLCVLPVGYTVVWIKPSWHCGPLSDQKRIFHIFTDTIKNNVPKKMHMVLDYIASPGIVIPLLVLLTLIIYYLVSLTAALREANSDLKIQLRRERTEERRKMFQIADRRRRGGSGGSGGSSDLANTPFAKWKKLIHTLPNAKSFDDTPKQESEERKKPTSEKENAKKAKAADFFAKFVKRAIQKSSNEPENDDNQNQDDATDNEQHDSLPDDRVNSLREVSPQVHKTTKQRSKPPQGESFDSDYSVKNVHIHETKKNRVYNVTHQTVAPVSRARKDSSSSIWSDNIPVIKISKTESSECILEKSEEKTSREDVAAPCETFKPRIKRMLRKQSNEVEDDIIFQVPKDNEVIKKILHGDSPKVDERIDCTNDGNPKAEAAAAEEEAGVKADNLPKMTSIDSVVKSTNSESLQTESSSDYKDTIISK